MHVKFLAIGDNAVDLYPHLSCGFAGGQALNTAVYATYAGSNSSYMGVMGNDENGEFLRNVLDEYHVDHSHCKIAQGENCFSTVTLQGAERIFGPDNRGGVSRITPLKLTPEDMEYISSFDMVHMTRDSYVDDLIPTVSSLGVPLSYDFSDNFTALRLEELCPLLSVAVLSLSGRSQRDATCVLREIAALGPTVVIATLGDKGSMLLYRGDIYTFGVYPTPVCDTLGAGDAFIGGALSLLAQYKGALKSSLSAPPLPSHIPLRVLKQGAHCARLALQCHGSFGKSILR